MPPEPQATTISPKLLELLCCPLTKAPLVLRNGGTELVSASARLAYPVREGIPILLPSEARTLTEDEVVALTTSKAP